VWGTRFIGHAIDIRFYDCACSAGAGTVLVQKRLRFWEPITTNAVMMRGIRPFWGVSLLSVMLRDLDEEQKEADAYAGCRCWVVLEGVFRSGTGN